MRGSSKLFQKVPEHSGEPEVGDSRAFIRRLWLYFFFFLIDCPFVSWCDAGSILQRAGIQLQEIYQYKKRQKKKGKRKMIEGSHRVCEVNTFLFLPLWNMVCGRKWNKLIKNVFLAPHRKSSTRGAVWDSVAVLFENVLQIVSSLWALLLTSSESIFAKCVATPCIL